MARKAKKEQQFRISPLGTQLMDYSVYVFSAAEKLMWILICVIAGGALGLLFYGGLFKNDGEITPATLISNAVVFLSGALICVKIALPLINDLFKRKRIDELKLQFRDMLESLSTSYVSGLNTVDAFSRALNDLTVQYSADSFIVKEVDEICKSIANNIPVEAALTDFGERSGIEDIVSFADVFRVCIEKGGNLRDAVRRTHDIISDKLLISAEIETKLASNRIQQRVINVMPVFIVAFLKLSNGNFADNFATPVGVIAISVGIVLFLAAFKWGARIVDIKG